ncbi:MAG: DUF3987 domain-containing protein [Bdellovibrionaceae bacterium]|nr:DUF3987 domain-containing protein [Pseudobdellovibrionaceae bacterium]
MEQRLPKQKIELKLHEMAFSGILGEYCKFIEDKTEADSAAILVQALTIFGNLVGPSPHIRVGADLHKAKLYALIVGKSSKARKGTSLGLAKLLFSDVEPTWHRQCIRSGLSSGEGLIYHLRDQEDSPADRRLFIEETEFASVLKNMERSGNILSAVMRNAWDNNPLSSLTKNTPNCYATNTHISIVGHITLSELQKIRNTADKDNGFSNRFLYIFSERRKLLPLGAEIPIDELSFFRDNILESIQFGQALNELFLAPEAQEYWVHVYPELAKDRFGTLGSFLSRAESQVLRIGLIYSLIDRSSQIRVDHLEAARAIWDYCENTVKLLFETDTGLPYIDKLIRILKQTPGGLTRTQIHHLVFQGNKKKEDVDYVLSHIESKNLAYKKIIKSNSKGRDTEIWLARDLL